MRLLIHKGEQMEQQNESTLDVIYANWRGYQEKLHDCIAPLTDAQLALSFISDTVFDHKCQLKDFDPAIWTTERDEGS